MTERENLMKQIKEYCFAAHEWNLYLDTHPTDRMALEYFRNLTKKEKELKKQYAEKYGPITASDVTDETEWTWVTQPWPWSN